MFLLEARDWEYNGKKTFVERFFVCTLVGVIQHDYKMFKQATSSNFLSIVYRVKEVS